MYLLIWENYASSITSKKGRKKINSIHRTSVLRFTQIKCVNNGNIIKEFLFIFISGLSCVFNYSLEGSIQQSTSNTQNCWNFPWICSQTSTTKWLSLAQRYEWKLYSLYVFIVLFQNLKADMEPQTPPFSAWISFFVYKITWNRTQGPMDKVQNEKIEIVFWVYFLAFAIRFNSEYLSILCSQFNFER